MFARKKGVMLKRFTGIAGICATLLCAAPSAQISFPKNQYYVGMGDSVAAGTGALPITNGYVYRLYEQGAFGQKQDVTFANVSVRGGRTWELRDNQVPQLLCTSPALRPTVITITAGANDFLNGDADIAGIAFRVVQSIDLLLHNGTSVLAAPVMDPVTAAPCPPLTNVTILVSNYYRIPVPVPAVEVQLDQALAGFDLALRSLLPVVQVPPGSRIGYVDLYAASEGRTGLVLVERRLGFSGPYDFDIHPTNLGHMFIADQFQKVFNSLQ
jgi:GDSL-like lipase/acylhydrolase family protein